MDLGIRGRTAVVAASSKGMGRAIAHALAAEGAKVAMCSRDGDAIDAAAAEIAEATRADVYAAAVDVTDPAAVAKFVGLARENLGPITICVANCGGPPPGKFEDFDLDDWKRAFDTSFMSTLCLIRETLPDMKAASWGRVVTVTSTSVRQPVDGLLLSNAIRASVIGLIKSLSNEYGRDNILFNNVGPGLIATDRLMSIAGKRASAAGVSVDEMIETLSANASLKRVGQPDEFAAVATFLCSEKASYVTGTSLMVDGGLTKGI